MSLQQIEPGAAIGGLRGEAAVCVLLDGSSDALACCLDSLVRNTDRGAKILFCGQMDPRTWQLLEALTTDEQWPHDCFLLSTGSRTGDMTQTLNTALGACAPADVAVLTRPCSVADGWLAALRAAALRDDRVATVSAFSDRTGPLSIADGGLAAEWTFTDAAAAIGTLRPLHPRVLCAAAPCVYLRRSALELVGLFDVSFQGDSALVDFSQRSLGHGLVHLAADNVLVADHGTSSDEVPRDTAGDHWLAARYPYLDDVRRDLENDMGSPLAYALASMRATLRTLRVTIDARALTPGLNGTKLHVLELVTALAQTESTRVRAVVPHDLGDYAQVLTDLPQLELLRADEVDRDTPIDDVVHRPHQVSSLGDLDLFTALGRRVVVTHQDLINFHNPVYFPNGEEWQAHRRLTRTALALADQVVFFSRHVADDAMHEGLIDAGRSQVVPIGIDHLITRHTAEPCRPRGAESLEGAGFLLCLGADLRHKNRPFAIDLLRALRERHGWTGKLVLAGPAVPHGSSAAEEVQARASSLDLDSSVITLGSVDEEGKAWLLRHATAVVYPSAVEGFGLVPFEAAQAGLPCLLATGTALAESLPPEAGSIVPWSAAESADRAIGLLCDQDVRVAHIRLVHEAGARFTWRRTAEHLLAVYRDAIRGPGPPGQAIAADALERERQLRTAGAEIDALRDAIDDHERRWSALGEDALRLVGPDGAIPTAVQRPLLAVSVRRHLSRPIFGLMKACYALSTGGRRGPDS